jgi:inhibitor of KinA sporulation pathway (predicted exonuclease)
MPLPWRTKVAVIEGLAVTIPAHYLVIDFEATCCDKGSIPPAQMEIIEIGAVMVQAADFAVVDEYQTFVKPARHRLLTGFCTQLTSIVQADVDGAPAFSEVMASFKSWLAAYPDYVFCSWGDYDLRQLQQDCALHGEPYPMNTRHINVKRRMAERQQLARPLGLGEAVSLVGLAFSGTHHRGIDDARNIVRLLPWIFGPEQLPVLP